MGPPQILIPPLGPSGTPIMDKTEDFKIEVFAVIQLVVRDWDDMVAGGGGRSRCRCPRGARLLAAG